MPASGTGRSIMMGLGFISISSARSVALAVNSTATPTVDAASILYDLLAFLFMNSLVRAVSVLFWRFLSMW